MQPMPNLAKLSAADLAALRASIDLEEQARRPQDCLLFLLKRTDKIDYDESDGMVVRACTETHARQLAAAQAGDEGSSCWLNANRVTAERLAECVGRPEVVLSSFNAG